MQTRGQTQGAPKGGAPKGGGPNPEKVGPRRVGAQTQKKWGPEGWGPEGWGPKPRKSGGPKGGAPKGGAPRRVGGPKLCVFFFPSPATKFVLFFPLWGSSRGILVVFEAPGSSNVHVWALWLSCETPAAKFWAVQGKGGPGEGRSRGRAVQGKGGPGEGRSREGLSKPNLETNTHT